MGLRFTANSRGRVAIFRQALLSLALGGSLLSAPAYAQQQSQAAPAYSQAGEEARLVRIFDEDEAREASLDPLEALYRGERIDPAALAQLFTDRLDRRELASAQQGLAALATIDPSQLSPESRISYDVFRSTKQREVAWLRPDVRALTRVRPLNHFAGLHVEFPTLMAREGVIAYRTEADYRYALQLQTAFAAVLDTARARGDALVLPVDREGLVDAAAIPDVALVAAMLVNNEIGVIQPVAEIAARAKAMGALMLCDAVQGFGRIAIPEGCDMIALSAHKIHGPKGVGALWIRDGVAPAPLLHGGDQEGGRSGTLSPALCVGFGVAARLMGERAEQDAAHVERLWSLAAERLAGWTINGSTGQRYRGNLNVRREGLDVARLMSDCRDIAFSAGSACASGSGRASHVLRAIGLSEVEARSSIRLGFGRYTREDELEDALARITAAADAQRLAA